MAQGRESYEADGIDPVYASDRNPKDTPPILAEIDGKCVLIDGNHRAYEARLAGRKSLSVYRLTAAESAGISREVGV